MYKTTSANMQRRAALKRLCTPLDPTTFKSFTDVQARRLSLVKAKQDIEAELHLNSLAIAKAKRDAYDHGIRLRGHEWSRLNTKRDELNVDLKTIEREFGVLKQVGLSRREQQNEEFPRIFINMAKQMLAEDVFHRIIAATEHAIGEKWENTV